MTCSAAALLTGCVISDVDDDDEDDEDDEVAAAAVVVVLVVADEVGSNNLIFGAAYPAHFIFDLLHLGGVGICDECLIGRVDAHLWHVGLRSSHFILLFLKPTVSIDNLTIITEQSIRHTCKLNTH